MGRDQHGPKSMGRDRRGPRSTSTVSSRTFYSKQPILDWARLRLGGGLTQEFTTLISHQYGAIQSYDYTINVCTVIRKAVI